MFNPEDPGQKSLLKYSGIIMEESTTALILVGIFAFLFCFAVIMAIYYGNRTKKELSGQPGVYKGSAGEPRWNGKLPAKADDYVQPRYVYENLVESYRFFI